MNRIIQTLIGAFSLAVVGCHDTPRKNPFDPKLTPAVAVTVSLDPGTGTAVVDWTPYDGRQPFAEYWILRQVQGLVTVDTLAVIRDADLTEFADSHLSPNTAYEYRVSVTNTSGYEATSDSKSTPGYEVSPVQLLDAEADAEAGAVRLRWTRFPGSRFGAYSVERRGATEDDFVAIGQINSRDDTLFTDTNVAPDASYVYRIVLEAAGQLWISNRSGRERYSLSPVTLIAAEPGNQEGVIRLTWSRFTGPGFESYQIRRIAESIDQELISTQTAIQDTSFVDRSALAGGAYVYTVTVQATGEELVSNPLVSSLTLPAVEIESIEMQSATASASLSWTRYEGPRFRAYQVWRRTTIETRMVAEIADRDVTALVDTSLSGNTEYIYRVVVATTRSEEVASTEVGGTIHALVDSWPLTLDSDESVRLYVEAEGRITALVAGEHQIRLLFFGVNGTLLDEQLLHSGVRIEPRSVATTVDEEGERFLTVGYKNRPRVSSGRNVTEGTEWGKFLLRFSPEGTLDSATKEYKLFEDFLQEREFTGYNRIFIQGGVGGVFFDNVEVSADGNVLFADDFEDGIADEWGNLFGGASVRDGKLRLIGRASIPDTSWNDFRFEADVSSAGNQGAIGVDVGPRILPITINLIPSENEVGLFRGGAKLDSEFLPGVPGAVYRLGLELVDGRLSASVQSPVVWREQQTDLDNQWTSLLSFEGSVTLTVGAQPYSLDQEGEAMSRTTLPSLVSEMRIWNRSGGTGTVGICLPESHQLAVIEERVQGSLMSWSFPTVGDRVQAPVGSGIGHESGHFVFPLSFDAGPDGRLFVLDAGNDRIQVFDRDRRFLTKWGQRGDGPGEFTFGRVIRTEPEDFSGSVVVDREGFIYVADVLNQRIQKFNP